MATMVKDASFDAGSRSRAAESTASAKLFLLDPSLRHTDRSNAKPQTETAANQMARIALREGEDAELTGQTRSLSRRLLALNLRGQMAVSFAEATSAGDSLLGSQPRIA